MRLSADWMTMADDRILEYLAEEGTSTPKRMADDARMRFSRSYINARCTELAQRSFVLNLGNGVYQITYRGQQYLDGELDAVEVETTAEAT
ncbi:MAG TPA: MarR family transcriptional regulator [Natrialbaceae archaeon]|nr:MarR family transcriptional regulator [Natrialbaceae archaeon]